MFKNSSDSGRWLFTLCALVTLLFLSLALGSITAMHRAEEAEAFNLRLMEDAAERDAEIEALTEEIEALKKEIEALKGPGASVSSEEKIAFLTFDDGPGVYTLEILDILKAKGVAASFFVVGTRVEQYPDRVRQLKASGNAVLPHTYLHQYNEIYKSKEAFIGDIEKVRAAITEVLGEAPKKMFRFPGGATNTIASRSLMKELTEYYRDEGYLYIDWNVSAEDAVARQPKDQIIRNVFRSVEGQNIAVILCHDVQADRGTVTALPEMIDRLKAQGYRFKTFDEITEAEIEQLKDQRVINCTLK